MKVLRRGDCPFCSRDRPGGRPKPERTAGRRTYGPTRTCLDAERAFAARLQGSCQSPVAGFARFDGDRLHVRGLVGAPDGSQVFADETAGSTGEAAALGGRLASRLLEAGAGPLLAALRAVP